MSALLTEMREAAKAFGVTDNPAGPARHLSIGVDRHPLSMFRKLAVSF
jgi:hypothetical protein